MAITCQEVCRDISDYVDDELDAKQRAALEEHFAECRRCTAVLEGTCNVIRLYRDERTLPLPSGFHDRLRRRLDQRPSLGSEERIHASRGAVLAWALTAAAAVPLSFALFFAKRTIFPGLGHQTPWDSRDPDAVTGLVAVSQTPDPRRHGLSHSWLFPFAWQTEISPSRGSDTRAVFAVPDLHREVHATEKRLASSERANFRAGAPSLADSSVPDYVMFAKEFQSGISLRSTRLNLPNCGV